MSRRLCQAAHLLASVVNGTVVLACLTVTSCPSGAHAQQLSAGEIVKKVAQTYSHISSFSIVGEETVDLDTDASGERFLHANPGRVPVGSHESKVIQVTLTISDGRKGKMSLKNKDDRKQLVVSTDGKVVWTFIPTQHAFTEFTAASTGLPRVGSNGRSGEEILQDYRTLVVDRFRNFAVYSSSARLERPRALKVGKDRKEFYVLAIQKRGSTRKQRLWVDKTDFTVWKFTDRTVSPPNFWGDVLETTVTVTAKQISMNPSLGKGDFIFTPPYGAKRVDSLTVPGENPF